MVNIPKLGVLFFLLNVTLVECQGDNVVSLPAYSVPLYALDTAERVFLENKPFEPYWGAIGDVLRADKFYLALPHSWEDTNPDLITNVTAVVVATITNVQLLAIAAHSQSLSSIILWYVVNAEVLEVKKGTWANKEISFLFSDGTEHSGYEWPYLKGLTHVFYLSGKQIVGQKPVLSFPPYSSKALKNWGAFCRDCSKDVMWINKSWIDLLNSEGRVANIQFVEDEFVVISRTGKYPDFSEKIRNYNDVKQIIVSIKTRSVVEEDEFRKACLKRQRD